MGFFSKVKDAVLGYNPITIATDIATGGKASEALGLEDSAYGLGSQALETAGDLGDDLRGKTAEDAANAASATMASTQMEQLNYLKEINALPQEYKEKALGTFFNLYGGGPDQGKEQAAIIDRAKQSPMYAEMMGSKESGEDAILRHSGMTGGLRSGNVQDALYDYNVDLENKALSSAYQEQIGGLKTLAGVPTYERDIAGTMGAIGETKAQGIIGAAESKIQGTQNLLNMGLYGLGAVI